MTGGGLERWEEPGSEDSMEHDGLHLWRLGLHYFISERNVCFSHFFGRFSVTQQNLTLTPDLLFGLAYCVTEPEIFSLVKEVGCQEVWMQILWA